jgi:FkbM family methyltransferase
MSILNKLRTLSNMFFNKFDYELVPVIPTSILDSIQVDEVIDVGVYRGTDFLLEYFPNKRFYFIEPNPATHSYISDHLCQRYDGKLFGFAASDSSGSLDFILDEDQSRSMAPETAKSNLSTIQVEKRKLDDILSKEVIGKALLKVDVEGFELDVLKGAKETLINVETVIVELRLAGKSANYYPQELFNFLAESGFCFKTIIGEGRRKNGLNYCDCLFLRNK